MPINEPKKGLFLEINNVKLFSRSLSFSHFLYFYLCSWTFQLFQVKSPNRNEMKYLLFLSIILLAKTNSCLVQCGRPNLNLERQFRRINSHIIDAVESDDIEVNINETKRWLEELSDSKEASLREAIESFLSLSRLVEQDIKCTKVSYEILRKNYLGTAGRSKDVVSSYVLPRRIDIIVNHYGVKHAKECHNYYGQGTS